MSKVAFTEPPFEFSTGTTPKSALPLSTSERTSRGVAAGIKYPQDPKLLIAA
jgi:hypothetical protein